MKHSSTSVTAAWVGLNLVPIVAVLILCFLLQSWLWSVALILLYLVSVVPYGFFVAMPLMVKIFRKPANSHLER